MKSFSVFFKKVIYILLCCITFIFSACSTQDDLVSAYNDNFTQGTPKPQTFLLSDETQEQLIPKDIYEINMALPYDITLAFSCPQECESYEWKITRLENEEPLSDGIMQQYHWQSKSIGIFMPHETTSIFYKETHEMETTAVYKLHLDVEYNEKQYYDSALLVIYENQSSIDKESHLETLSFSISEDYPAESANTRSITAEPISLTDDSLTFILSGTSNTGLSFSKPVSISELSVQLESVLWNLTITAWTNYGTAEEASVLKGSSSADLRTGSKNISFVLSSCSLYAKSSVSLSGYFYHNGVVSEYTAGIYTKLTGKLVSGTEKTYPAQNSLSDSTKSTFTYEAESILPGNYLFKIFFYNEKGTQTGFYSDTIILDPGRKVEASLGTLNIIGTIPSKPEKLCAYYKTDTLNETEGTYCALIKWAPKEKDSASEYEIKLTEYKEDGSTVAAETIYGSSSRSSDSETITDFLTSDIYSDGTLLYGNTECSLRLKLSVKYEIKIRSRNDTGSSDWTMRTVDSTDAESFDEEYITHSLE